MDQEQPPLADYAIIGDCRSAALVSRCGSIDWLCWPIFGGPSIFGALLDPEAGCWSIAPTARFATTRRYLSDTNVLETRFETDTGTLLVTDLMPVSSEEERHAMLVPEHELLRIVTCEQGSVEIETVLSPRPAYGTSHVRARDAGALGLRFETREGLLTLRADAPMELLGRDARGRAHLREGDTAHFSLTFATEWPAVLPPLGPWSQAALERSITWWRDWVAGLSYEGLHRSAVIRSALALRLLVFSPSGAVVAAPTTSLPERVGGDLNWDYRYCWLRDAALTVRVLWDLGCHAEAEAFVSWALHSTRLTRPQLKVLYDVYGNQPAPETILSSWAGYRGSRPVRVGNAAIDQLQLDVYGEVIDAVAILCRKGKRLDRETQQMLCHFGGYVCQNWQRPDEGIWEPRSGRAHRTHSRLLCWTALDKLIELHASGHLRGERFVERFVEERARIRRDIEERAWNPTLASYTSLLDGDDVDASLLLIPWYGFARADSERMQATYARILERLGAGNGLLYRYRSGDSGGEGAFGIASFWSAEYLALGGGTAREAADVFGKLCRCGNDVGLFAEEIDPSTGAALGNFPQAFTHIGLISAALSLTRRIEEQTPDADARLRARPSQEDHP